MLRRTPGVWVPSQVLLPPAQCPVKAWPWAAPVRCDKGMQTSKEPSARERQKLSTRSRPEQEAGHHHPHLAETQRQAEEWGAPWRRKGGSGVPDRAGDWGGSLGGIPGDWLGSRFGFLGLVLRWKQGQN